jgi:phosphatidylserine/phosphatidylglycerophosphate/cardiolipin synthase-like enzyme
MNAEAETSIKRLGDLKKTDVVTELKGLHTQGVELVEPTDLSGSLRGRHNLYNHLELTIRGAEQTVTLVTTASGLLRKVEGLKPVFKEVAKRGVKVRIAAPMTKETVEAAKELDGIAEVRDTKLKARFCVVDAEEVIFMVMDDAEVHPTYDIGIWINTPFFASALEQLFELAWKDMKKVKAK